MFPVTIHGVVLTVLIALQVQALKITYPTNKVNQIDVNTPLLLSWTSDSSDPELMDIVVKYMKEFELTDFSSEATGMLVPAQSIPSKSNIFPIFWEAWPYRVGMFCQIILGNSTTHETFDHTDTFQLVNINPTSAYGPHASTLPSTTASPANASSSTTSFQYPGYGSYSVSLPGFSELNSDMTKWACTQTSWDFRGQSPDIRSYLKTATDCEQYSTKTTGEDVTPNSTEQSLSASSKTTTATAPISTTSASNSTSTAANSPVTSAGSTTAVPTQTSNSLPARRRPHAVVVIWVHAVLIAVITITAICE